MKFSLPILIVFVPAYTFCFLMPGAIYAPYQHLRPARPVFLSTYGVDPGLRKDTRFRFACTLMLLLILAAFVSVAADEFWIAPPWSSVVFLSIYSTLSVFLVSYCYMFWRQQRQRIKNPRLHVLDFLTWGLALLAIGFFLGKSITHGIFSGILHEQSVQLDETRTYEILGKKNCIKGRCKVAVQPQDPLSITEEHKLIRSTIYERARVGDTLEFSGTRSTFGFKPENVRIIPRG
ncbi:hypothetical protein [uncultured Roseovarius sp.]|uniref:hypothetical protein n=1 Tax=uncultured Roseovarius sp. TaxID=293344 RepID=UPI002602EBB2|nr:hypothetical protein [uncultured Roseovarius sp.]